MIPKSHDQGRFAAEQGRGSRSGPRRRLPILLMGCAVLIGLVYCLPPIGTDRPSLASQERLGDVNTNKSGVRTASQPSQDAGTDAKGGQSPAIDDRLAVVLQKLAGPSGAPAVLTPEEVIAWKSEFQKLVARGGEAIPAIRSFLLEGTTHPFSTEVWRALGYSSARLAMVDALRQIGGAEAASLMRTLLSQNGSPREIAMLARGLDETTRGQFRPETLAAARAGLQRASTVFASAETTEAKALDVAPLFEVFQHYGDASVVPDLEKAAAQWSYYAAIALADLADGEGLPSLLKMAEKQSGSSRMLALGMIAQLSASNGEAKEFLHSQVAAGQIPPSFWPYLSGSLAGEEYFPVDSAITLYPNLRDWSDLKSIHIHSGNQNLYVLPGSLTETSEGLNQRLTLMNDLLSSTSDATAQENLRKSITTLEKRLAQIPETPTHREAPQEDPR